LPAAPTSTSRATWRRASRSSRKRAPASRAGMRHEDAFVDLVEVAKDDRSFGTGEAQYA
jgi:hypothetical protein